MGVMRVQRFGTRVAVGPGGRAVIAVAFDPDQAWGAKAEHPVGGTVNGRRVRGRIVPGGRGWVFILTPMWMRDADVAAGDDVIIELAPEGPQRGDLADDVAAALEANPAAAAFRHAGAVLPQGLPALDRCHDPAAGLARGAHR